MQRQKLPLVLVLLLALTFTTVFPVAPASAASLTDIVPQLSDNSSGGGGGIINILLGLLLGKLLGNLTPTGSNSTSGGEKTVAGTASGDAVIATAKQYMGTPYVWGGDTPGSFDCSGFTQYVMKQNGVTLSRTAAEQFATGTPVNKEDLRVGDLVFFTTYKPGASHVGFYMGGGQFIHASSAAGQVTISSLNEAYYTEHYIGARRYLH